MLTSTRKHPNIRLNRDEDFKIMALNFFCDLQNQKTKLAKTFITSISDSTDSYCFDLVFFFNWKSTRITYTLNIGLHWNLNLAPKKKINDDGRCVSVPRKMVLKVNKMSRLQLKSQTHTHTLTHKHAHKLFLIENEGNGK